MNLFFSTVYNKSIDNKLKFLKKSENNIFDNAGEREAIKLFNFVNSNVIAYQKFLKINKCDLKGIKNPREFKRLPLITKNNYIKQNSLKDLVPPNELANITTFSATSGSTGEPTFFPRSEEQDRYYEYISEIFLTNQFGVSKKKSTLVIIGFGLGIWIGGIFTYKNFNKLASKGYRLALLPVGPQKDLYLKSLKKFGNLFDQVILAGYPPFIKDIVDEAHDYNIYWRDYNLKILTAAEGYSEDFRDYIAKKTHIKNIYTDFVNIYGSVELGTMGHETPLTTLIRRLACRNKAVYKAVFGESTRLPTLAQYYPYITYFEEIDGELAATGYGSSIPLIRYKFADRGGVILFSDMVRRLKKAGIDILKEARRIGLGNIVLKLPFVYVYERSDLVVNVAGINIFPEYIKSGLQRSQVQNRVTGKFSMLTRHDKQQNQFLDIHVELKKNVRASASLLKVVQRLVVNALRMKSTEYNHLYQSSLGEFRKRIIPKIILLKYEHPAYFSPGIKQKWVVK